MDFAYRLVGAAGSRDRPGWLSGLGEIRVKAETRTLQQVLHGDRRFVVPVYQRPYVWERERQWEPLWEDLEATAFRLAEARAYGHAKGLDAAESDRAAPPHFLGAIVIEQSLTVTGAVDTRLVVDGQQRLTTLQLLCRGVLDALEEIEASTQCRARIRKGMLNDEEVVDPAELQKLTPRRADQAAYLKAMAHEPSSDDTSTFAAAREFFAESALGLLQDDEFPNDPFAEPDSPAHGRAELLVSTLLGLVKLVVIDLEDVDDAQVIFEALNARNTPLSATDLVKNLLFLRAQSENQDPDELYESLWKRFDDDSEWWLTLSGIGHAQRARQDWLLGDWLIAQIGRAINVGRLYGEFRRWLDLSGTKAFDALSTLNEYANAYEMIYGKRPGATLAERRTFETVERLGITAATPLILWLLVQPTDVLPAQERERAVRAIESFVVRRMAGKYQTRAYNQAFVEVLRAAQKADAPGQAVIEALAASPHGYEWPETSDLEVAFADSRYYGPGGISQDRLRLLLGAVDAELIARSNKSETLTVQYDELQIEHVIPQSWRTHWPVIEDDEAIRALAEQERDRHLNRIGNLTLVTGPLNVSLSHDPWEAKRAELQKHSKLALNARLIEEDDWDEERIVARGKWLATQLEEIWPGPSAHEWSLDGTSGQ